MNSSLDSPHRQPLRRSYLLVAGSIVFISALAVVAAIEPRYKELSTIVPHANSQAYRGQPTPELITLLDSIGWSVTTWAAYFTAFETLLGAIGIGVGLFIIWKKPDHWFPVFMAVGMATSFTGPVYNLESLRDLHAAWDIPARLLTIVGFIGFAGGFALFPNGRFVPTWTRYLSIIWVAYVVVTELFVPDWAFPRRMDITGPSRGIVLTFMTAVWMGLGIISQTYRYFWRSTKLERQQTKWVVFGLVWFFVFSLPFLVIPAITSQPLLRSPDTPGSLTVLIVFVSIFYGNAVFMLIAMAFAVLRYRLWDIDIIIRRTLIYTVLTTILGIVYFGGIVLTQQAFKSLTGQTSELAIVISTLLIAALFTPLRRRVQGVIDRRLYRKKYDIEQVLTDFQKNLRDEVDMQTLKANLIGVVSETMQPDKIALWVRHH